MNRLAAFIVVVSFCAGCREESKTSTVPTPSGKAVEEAQPESRLATTDKPVTETPAAAMPVDNKKSDIAVPGETPSSDSPTDKAAAPLVPSGDGIVRCTAIEFGSALAKGEAEFRKMHKESKFEITGAARTFNYDLGVIRLVGNEDTFRQGDDLTCWVKDIDSISGLNRFQVVAVQGTYRERYASSWELMDCEVIKVGPSNAIEIPASELADQWDEDRYAIEPKINKRTVVVTGNVTETRNDSIVIFQPKDSVQIQFHFKEIKEATDFVKSLKPGDLVTLTAELQLFGHDKSKILFDARLPKPKQ